MAAFLLDTSALVDWLKGHPAVGNWMEAHRAQGDDLGVGPISVAELMSGIRPEERASVKGVIDRLTWVPLSEAAAVHAGELFWVHERAGTRISMPDLLQAASALTSNRTVVSSNVRHYPDVLVVDPRAQDTG